VPVSAERRAVYAAAAEAAGVSLHGWVRMALDRAVEVEGASGGAGHHRASTQNRSQPVEGPEQAPRRGVPEHRGERDRWADAQVRALQAEGGSVEPPAAPVVEEQEPLMRVGRCRDHPNALPRFNDVTRCAWGCRLPPT